MSEDGKDQPLKIIRQAIVAPFEVCVGLSCAMKHQGSPGAHAQAELLGLARAVDNFECVVEQTVVDFHLRDRLLYRDYVGSVEQRLGLVCARAAPMPAAH